jgi:hypothetical protein
MADFPTDLVPSSRSFNPGDWPVKRFNSESGAEIRILRGSNRLNSVLELSYDNIADTEADKFLKHYRDVKGTYQSWRFAVAPSAVGAFKGWGAADTSELEVSPWGMAWRYDAPPEITQAKKGRSNVRVTLRGVSL